MDTHFANRIIEKAILDRIIPGLCDFENLKREVNVGGLRADFLLTSGESRCIVEVKSSTIVENGVARFPDSVTPRGLRQLEELTLKAASGDRVVLVYVVQRNDVKGFMVTGKFHPAYAAAFRNAMVAGVEPIALAVPVYTHGIGLPRVLPIQFE